MPPRLPLLSALVAVALAATAGAQVPDSTRPVRKGGTVSGVVHDSLGRSPLGGAIVQLVATDTAVRFGRTVVADSLGRFALGDAPAGRYTIGFFHPMLDSLGLEPPLREVFVGAQPVRADLGIPSPARLRAAICGPRSLADSSSLILGIVRDASTRQPVGDAGVAAGWFDLELGKKMVSRVARQARATSSESGWFALCGLPHQAALSLQAARGVDTTALLEVRMPFHGVLRRDLYLSAAGAAPVRLSGSVRTSADSQPLSGARIAITGGPETRSNDRGEWTLVDVPPGTRILEVRAVGYYPESRAVDAIEGAAPVRVALTTFKAVLDTVRVVAQYDRDRSGFQERRRMGIGRYLDAFEIRKHQPNVMFDILRRFPGILIQEGELTMRGLNLIDRCKPSIFLDGKNLTALMHGAQGQAIPAIDLDDWVRPSEVVGVEVYMVGTAPTQFQGALEGCGTLVIWTQR